MVANIGVPFVPVVAHSVHLLDILSVRLEVIHDVVFIFQCL